MLDRRVKRANSASLFRQRDRRAARSYAALRRAAHPSTCLHIVKAFMAFPLARLLYLGAGRGLLARVPAGAWQLHHRVARQIIMFRVTTHARVRSQFCLLE